MDKFFRHFSTFPFLIDNSCTLSCVVENFSPQGVVIVDKFRKFIASCRILWYYIFVFTLNYFSTVGFYPQTVDNLWTSFPLSLYKVIHTMWNLSNSRLSSIIYIYPHNSNCININFLCIRFCTGCTRVVQSAWKLEKGGVTRWKTFMIYGTEL